MLFALGFLSLMLGLAMLVLGEMPISKTRRVPAQSSRIAGAILVAYFPLVLAIRFLWVRLELDRYVAGNIVFAILWVLLAMAAGWVALRGAFPKKVRQSTPRLAGIPEADTFAIPEPALASEDTVIPEMLTIEEPAMAFDTLAANPKKPVAPPKKSPAPIPKSSKKPASDNPFDFS